jgi:hypothetical protein
VVLGVYGAFRIKFSSYRTINKSGMIRLMSFVQIADKQLVTHTIIAKLVRNTIFVNNASGLIINFLEGEATNGSPWMDDIFLPFY